MKKTQYEAYCNQLGIKEEEQLVGIRTIMELEGFLLEKKENLHECRSQTVQAFINDLIDRKQNS